MEPDVPGQGDVVTAPVGELGREGEYAFLENIGSPQQRMAAVQVRAVLAGFGRNVQPCPDPVALEYAAHQDIPIDWVDPGLRHPSRLPRATGTDKEGT